MPSQAECMDLAWGALAGAALVFSLGAVSPGPSLVMVIRNTMMGGRGRGIACALGHGLGFGIYAFVAVFGLIFLIESSPMLFSILQWCGILFLIRIGWVMLAEKEFEIKEHESKSDGFGEGFLIAFLNPKIAIFMLAVLSQVIEADMGFATEVAMAGLGMIIDATWYVIVALCLSNQRALDWMDKRGLTLVQITGALLLGFALWMTMDLLLA